MPPAARRPGVSWRGRFGNIVCKWCSSRFQVARCDRDRNAAPDATLKEDSMGEHTDKAKGNIKEGAGKVTGDKEMESEGKTDKAKGGVKGAWEDTKGAVKDAT
jgi:uncharacterized protein YjbJ (UPF0337 family)